MLITFLKIVAQIFFYLGYYVYIYCIIKNKHIMSTKKTVQVQQFKFNGGKYRNVEIPTSNITPDTWDKLDILEQVFHYGQNDFQPQSAPSVSVGDVINLDSEYFVVQNFGFKKIKSEEYENLKRVCNRALKNGTRYDVELYNEIGEAALKIS